MRESDLVGGVRSYGSLSPAQASGPTGQWGGAVLVAPCWWSGPSGHCWFQSDHCSFDMRVFGGVLDFSGVEIPCPKGFLI